MLKASFKGEFFGVLQTKSGEVVVVYDSVLPKASPGKIYLYNTAKDKIIEFVEDIVKLKVKELKGYALDDAREKYADRWLEAKQIFLMERGLDGELEGGVVSEKSKIDEILSDINEDETVIDDELEDL